MHQVRCIKMAGTIEHHKPLPDIHSMLHQLCLQLPDHGLGILQLCFQAPILGNTEVSPAVLSLDRRVLDSVTTNNTHNNVLYSATLQCIYLLCIQYTFLFCILQQYTIIILSVYNSHNRPVFCNKVDDGDHPYHQWR